MRQNPLIGAIGGTEIAQLPPSHRQPKHKKGRERERVREGKKEFAAKTEFRKTGAILFTLIDPLDREKQNKNKGLRRAVFWQPTPPPPSIFFTAIFANDYRTLSVARKKIIG